MHEHRIAALGRHAPAPRRDRAGARAVYRAVIYGHPTSDLSEPLLGLRWNRPVGTWADVEQQVRAHTSGPHQIVNQLARRLVMMIGEIEAPRIVHRERGLERQTADGLGIEAGGVRARKVLLECLHV